MSERAADVLIDAVHAWGVDVIFGMSGDGINGIMEALRKGQDVGDGGFSMLMAEFAT